MKIYDLVKKILTIDEQSRNSDKECIWQVYKSLGIVKQAEHFGTREVILKENFLSGNSPSFESIRRSRQKIQELHPELGATSKSVIIKRKQLEDQRGTHIYREVANALF